MAKRKSKKQRERRGLEGNQPITWSDLAAILSDGPTDAGVDVTEGNGLQFSAVFCAVRLLAEAIGVLPLKWYQKSGPKTWASAEDHPTYDLLHDRPNPWMTAAVFKETLQAHVVTWGNGYARIITDGQGRPAELWPLMPNVTKPVKVNSQLLYQTRDAAGGVRYLYPEEVLHVPGLGFDGLVGYSVIHQARQAIGLAKAAEKLGAKSFGNGSQMSGVLEHPGELGEEGLQHLRQSLAEKHAGLDNAWRPLILEEGMKWQSIGIPAKDAQFLESRKFQVSEIARFYRVPPHMLYEFVGATYSNIEQLSQEFIRYSLSTWLVKWEQECTRKLIMPSERRGYKAEFVTQAFLRGDTQSRYTSYRTGREGGWLSVNEIRDYENLPPIDGGDNYLEPLNMRPVGEGDGEGVAGGDGEGVGDPPPVRGLTAERATKACCGMFAAAVGRVVRKESNAIARAAKRTAGDRDAFGQWLATFTAEQRLYMRAELQTPCEALVEILVCQVGEEERLVEVLEEVGLELAAAAERYVQGLVRDLEANGLDAEPWKRREIEVPPAFAAATARRIADLVRLKLSEVLA